MHIRSALALMVAFSVLGLVGIARTQGAPTQTPEEAEISKVLGTLRKMSDEDRTKAHKDLAARIKALPVTERRLQLALSLSFVSTEGDFGTDTLQAVTDTLVAAVKAHPKAVAQERDMAYGVLAQLAKYELMSVSLDDAGYKKAQGDLDAIDEARAKVDFTLTDLNGKTWSRSSLKGKVVIVNFWATWCPPCRKEMPDLEELVKMFKGELVVLSISDEERKVVEPFIAEHKYTFPVLLDPGRKVHEAYKVDSIPKNFIYDREGKLVAQSMDMRTRGQFLALLARAGLK